MFTGFHPLQLIIILVIALLIFGPRKLPEMGSAIGKSIKEFRKGMNELGQPKDAKDDTAKVPEKSPEALREELETLEREIAAKKAAAAQEEKARAEESAD
jgi:sec-independent protein translocase protein TatA